ncbi:MAG: acyl-CoA dehydratase activase [Planctomycetes bacterium]|nr:acyl-CoA dehydratase activase [Planctomycetota bacterium]
MSYVGVNIGALTVKVVALRGENKNAKVVSHQGRPLEVLKEVLAAEFTDGEYFAVSGQLGHLSEVVAIQRALQELDSKFNAVASLGGESFLVYFVAQGRVINVLSHNKCAAGSGEFFVQQIGRMGLSMDEAIQLSFAGKVVPLASRCSVHCKSDITHKLNRKEATREDILHTLHDSMANKVVALLEKGQCELKRVLLIGGVTHNAAMLAALREKLPATEFVVLPESPWFEAWGSALIARDEPTHTSPQISVQPTLGTLPPMSQYADQVTVIPAPAWQAPPDGPMVLGVDAGSTTTKAILLDPATRAVVVSHYTRTRGDPVAATRECLRALADHIGNRQVFLIGTTGSARELVGAYLETSYVYNEISAHAAGATHFDPDVDTIFEIGGQDSKYIHLHNGVPIDYAMNNACSAGTGSFLEESAQGDLGITLEQIGDLALAAPTPVHFKATCAAFINSDIRIAQQQGYTRENIVAGLVYAIADNYLNRVKGSRFVGKKVFLQGGVALNRAVGHAFAHSVDRPVVIPPCPELLGALGVALLALDRSHAAPTMPSSSKTQTPPTTDLLGLIAKDMKLVGRFTCGACKMYCTIDRFEIAGRRFPFGGRCSLFENVWKQRTRLSPAADLVAERGMLLYGLAKRPPPRTDNGQQRHSEKRVRIGIPKALTTHSLFPLYSTFFSQLGMDVVLSGVDPRGELKSFSSFCFPVQIAHGAVLDLAHQGVNFVFMPHVMRMPHASANRESFLCPITQAGPYFLAKAFPDIHFLSPLLDFSEGYGEGSALIETAVQDLGVTKKDAELAWGLAVTAQTETERAMQELGRQALEKALASLEPAIVLAGHSYNAFSPEASQSVGKKLSSMGVVAIPSDCLASTQDGPTSWHYANQILNAAEIVKRSPNLFLLCISNFSCTVDAFTHAQLASEMGTKPYLILEIDAHTADGGIQTRLEAFLDIIRNYRVTQASEAPPFQPCRLGDDSKVILSSGEEIRLSDPRVKLYFPSFSPYHAQALAMAFPWVGLHAGEVIPLDRSQLEQGLRYTTGRECLPLPICIGQLLHIHKKRQPGEAAGLFMMQGGAPCVIDAYMGYLQRFIVEQQLPDLFMFCPGGDKQHGGLSASLRAKTFWPATLVADLLVEIEQVLRVVGAPGSVDEMKREWERFRGSARTLDQFHAELPEFVKRLSTLPRVRDPLNCPTVVVTGDFFTRFSPFFMEGVTELYSEAGIILKPVDLSDLALYIAYHGLAQTADGWGMKPGPLAFAKACTRIFQPAGQQYLQRWLTLRVVKNSDEYYREMFEKTGLLISGPKDAATQYKAASEHISPQIFGEVVPNVGEGIEAERKGYDGILLIGPFNCLPFRISEAILKPQSIQRGMPLLSYESDGYAVAPSFIRQVQVHIQQVMEHAACKL